MQLSSVSLDRGSPRPPLGGRTSWHPVRIIGRRFRPQGATDEKVTLHLMPTYQVTYFKRGLRADDPFASELRTEFVKAERIVNEGHS